MYPKPYSIYLKGAVITRAGSPARSVPLLLDKEASPSWFFLIGNKGIFSIGFRVDSLGFM